MVPATNPTLFSQAHLLLSTLHPNPTMSEFLVVPGQVITTESGFLRGHGTYVQNLTGSSSSSSSSSADSSSMVIDRGESDGGGDQQSARQPQQQLVACVAGVVSRVNKLISVIPLKQVYQGEVGDLVIGRITEVRARAVSLPPSSPSPFRISNSLPLSLPPPPHAHRSRRSAGR